MRVVTFGEMLLRLASPGHNRLFQNGLLEATFCGSEANVAVSLANFGVETVFVTKLPEGDVGRAATGELRRFGVGVDDVAYGVGRMGLYYLEKGVSQRPSRVIYDRAHSAFAEARRYDFQWDQILETASWFHWSGINPALSGELALTCKDACEAARKRGVTVSCDLNYRAKLWSPTEARLAMEQLMPYVDVCLANEEDAAMMLGIEAEGVNVEAGAVDGSRYVEVAKKICDRYGCRAVATTLRESFSASHNGWSAMLYDASSGISYFSKKYDIQVVDRVGAGDSFSAGLIFAISSNMLGQDAVEFAVAASCLKHCVEGDFNRVSVEEVEDLLTRGGNGRVVR